MKKILLLSPTSRERRNLPLVADELGCEIIFEEFDGDYFDDLLGENPDLDQPSLNIVELIESTAKKYQNADLTAVTSAVGYPGMSAASILAEMLGLPGPSPESIMLCEHKFYSRQFQKKLVPEATPDFHLIDPQNLDTIDSGIGFPSFLKPVKSCMSKNANIAWTRSELLKLVKTSLLPDQFINPFNDMLAKYTNFEKSATYLLHESLLHGIQVSLEGYVFDKQVHVMGVVDAVMFPGTLSFKRWQYPSRLPQGVLDRMNDIATRFFTGIGYNNALFNMELFYDADTDQIGIIEINPKIASQFPQLFQRVDGFSTYKTMLEVAMGQRPHTCHRRGEFAVAASCVLRIFEDQHILAVPDAKQIAAVTEEYPDAQVQIYGKPGRKLSDEVQDSASFRYGLIDIGAQSEEELEDKFEICKQMLKFEFAPVSTKVGSHQAGNS